MCCVWYQFWDWFDTTGHVLYKMNFYYRLLKNTLMLHDFQHYRLKLAFCKFYDRYNDLICKNNLSLGRILSYQLLDRFSHIIHGLINISQPKLDVNDRSERDVYSSQIADPTSGVWGGPCLHWSRFCIPYIWFTRLINVYINVSLVGI